MGRVKRDNLLLLGPRSLYTVDNVTRDQPVRYGVLKGFTQRSADVLDRAGKYLGHIRREHDGRFGTLPVYEDYGEESFPH